MVDGCINIRGDAENADFLSAATSALGQDLPLRPNSTTRNERCIFWLGPDEWLVMTSADERQDVLAELESALSNLHAAVNDLSGGYVITKVRGDSVIDMLAKGCTLDLSSMPVGDCAQTGIGKTGVLLSRDAESEFTIIVRRSFALYLSKWLAHSSRSHGIEFA